MEKTTPHTTSARVPVIRTQMKLDFGHRILLGIEHGN